MNRDFWWKDIFDENVYLIKLCFFSKIHLDPDDNDIVDEMTLSTKCHCRRFEVTRSHFKLQTEGNCGLYKRWLIQSSQGTRPAWLLSLSLSHFLSRSLSLTSSHCGSNNKYSLSLHDSLPLSLSLSLSVADTLSMTLSLALLIFNVYSWHSPSPFSYMEAIKHILCLLTLTYPLSLYHAHTR